MLSNFVQNINNPRRVSTPDCFEPLMFDICVYVGVGSEAVSVSKAHISH